MLLEEKEIQKTNEINNIARMFLYFKRDTTIFIKMFSDFSEKVKK